MTVGIAKGLYLSKTKSTAPWPSETEPPSWKAAYSALDIGLARALGSELGGVSNSSLATLSHLCAAVQQGHMCIHVTQDTLCPSVRDLLDETDVDSLTLQKLICSGIDPLIEKISHDHRFLHYHNERLYFHRHWIAETRFLEELNRLHVTSPALSFNSDRLTSQLQHLVDQKILQREQADAILKVSQHTLTIITGGPGTGKTYTAGHCLRMLWSALSDSQRQQMQISLAAPTGKAAANLEASVAREVGGLDAFPAIEAYTLHALLGRRRAAALNSDLILVDECSMIDAQLFADLLSVVKPGARLILMGDPDQLPAVEAGGLFLDLVESHANTSSLARLTTCRRTESEELLQLASAVRQADWTQVHKQLAVGHAVRLLHFSGNQYNQQCQLVSHLVGHFDVKIESVDDAAWLHRCIGAFRALSPLRKGPWGADALNALCVQRARELGHGLIPIIITQNDYEQGLFNGDVGVLAGDQAFFPQQDSVRRFNSCRLPAHEFAYCLSVHKCQGSEFQHVLLLIPEGSEHFGRGLLYTAATRARCCLDVLATEATLQRMLQQNNRRMSGVIERMAKNITVRYDRATFA